MEKDRGDHSPSQAGRREEALTKIGIQGMTVSESGDSAVRKVTRRPIAVRNTRWIPAESEDLNRGGGRQFVESDHGDFGSGPNRQVGDGKIFVTDLSGRVRNSDWRIRSEAI